jgi:hypothetical protein
MIVNFENFDKKIPIIFNDQEYTVRLSEKGSLYVTDEKSKVTVRFDHKDRGFVVTCYGDRAIAYEFNNLPSFVIENVEDSMSLGKDDFLLRLSQTDECTGFSIMDKDGRETEVSLLDLDSLKELKEYIEWEIKRLSK